MEDTASQSVINFAAQLRPTPDELKAVISMLCDSDEEFQQLAEASVSFPSETTTAFYSACIAWLRTAQL